MNFIEKKFNGLMREVTALKTAHKRGLGLIDFYRYTADWTVIDKTNAKITAIAKQIDSRPFFCQLSANIPKALQYFSEATVNGNTITWTIYGSYFNAGKTLTIEAITTVELESFTVEAA